MFSSLQKSGDELLLSQTVKDQDDFFEVEKNFLIEYYVRLRDCTIRADKMTVVHKSLADNYIKISTGESFVKTPGVANGDPIHL